MDMWMSGGDIHLHPTEYCGMSLQWRHNESGGVSNHQRLDCLLNRVFRRRSKKTSKLRVTGLCEGKSPVTGEFLAQRANSAKIFPFDDVIMWFFIPAREACFWHQGALLYVCVLTETIPYVLVLVLVWVWMCVYLTYWVNSLWFVSSSFIVLSEPCIVVCTTLDKGLELWHELPN